MVLYRYRRLNPDQFRVLNIIEFEPVLLARLTHHDDNVPTIYHALSYAWGDQPPTETIECDDQQIKVTRHLLEGLKSIYATTGISVIWVDAICINQEDDNEKASQVAKMHRIYREATSVVVWLGSSKDDSDLAMDAIVQASRIEQPELPTDENEALISILRHSENTPILFDPSMFTPVARLSDRAWFRRLWIAQEYFCARAVTFCCGQKSISGEAFIKVLMSLSIHSFGRTVPKAFGDEDVSKLYLGFKMLTELQRIKSELERLTFFELVLHGRKRVAKEPLDRIYAVYGMAENLDNPYKKAIPINYSADNKSNYWNVFISFAKVALLHEPHLRLLSVVDSADRPKELPSWCPNLNSTPRTQHLEGLYEAGWPPMGMNPPNCCVHFKAKTGCHFLFSADQNSMRIWGARFDVVNAIQSSVIPDSNFDRDDLLTAKPWASSMLAWLENCEKFCQQYIKDPQQAKVTWNEILVGSRNIPERRAQHSDLETYHLMWIVLGQITILDTPDVPKIDTKTLKSSFAAVYLWIQTLQDQWENRVLFATTNGRLGYANDRIQSGDQLCMFYGGRLIYILRDSGAPHQDQPRYQFVSEAYVFDHMDGEIFQLFEDGLVDEEQFTIV